MTSNVLELQGISKSFPGVRALADISLIVRHGVVHAICGENGAGKSSMIKIATGALNADSGIIRIGDKKIDHPNRRLMQRLGVRAIFQERQIAPDLSVTENVLLDHLPKRYGRVDWRAARKLARQRLQAFEIDLNIDAPIRALSVAQLQMIEIARAVSFEARLIVMDEPTASLSRHELGPLFRVINRLRSNGVSVLFISHHLEEIFQIADEITVMRDGAVVGQGPTSNFTFSSITEMMFGRTVDSLRISSKGNIKTAQPFLMLKNVNTAALHNVSLSVDGGEILAVTGGIGAGVSELAQVVAGASLKTSGEILVADQWQKMFSIRNRRHALKLGVAFLPADRKRQGLLLERTLADNLVLGQQAAGTHPIFTPKSAIDAALTLASAANVKSANIDVVVGSLSGGNQQKAMIGRWIGVKTKIMIFAEPTAGIDIASKVEIYRELRQLADTGVAILICSTDFQEVGHVADRIIVMRSGQIVGEIDGCNATEELLLRIEMS